MVEVGVSVGVCVGVGVGLRVNLGKTVEFGGSYSIAFFDSNFPVKLYPL